MTYAIAWSLFLLGFAHIVFGCIRFRRPLAEAVADGYVGQFKAPQIRYSAFWFLVFGPLLILCGNAVSKTRAEGRNLDL